MRLTVTADTFDDWLSASPCMSIWLMKSEPDEASIDDLAAAPQQSRARSCMRNDQARDFMRNAMQLGDRGLFHHSASPPPTMACLVTMPALATMQVLQRGNRLSVTPLTGSEWRVVLALMRKENPSLV